MASNKAAATMGFSLKKVEMNINYSTAFRSSNNISDILDFER